MSLLSICTNVAQDLGIDDQAMPPIIGSQSPSAKRLLQAARRALYQLVRRAAWADLVIEHEWQASGTSEYPLPPDFLKMINDTVWERTRFWAMRGALSPQQWQRYRSSIWGRATIWRRWRIRIASGKQVGTAATFSLDPAVAATDMTSQFVFEYQSAWAVQRASDGTMSPVWTSDNDVSLLDEDLLELGVRWRVMRRLGLPYDDERDEYERQVDMAVARDGGTATLNLVPWFREDFIGQYSLGAFPPQPPPPGAPQIVVGPPRQQPSAPPPAFAGAGMPAEIARLLAPYEQRDWQPPPGSAPLRPLPPAPGSSPGTSFAGAGSPSGLVPLRFEPSNEWPRPVAVAPLRRASPALLPPAYPQAAALFDGPPRVAAPDEQSHWWPPAGSAPLRLAPSSYPEGSPGHGWPRPVLASDEQRDWQPPRGSAPLRLLPLPHPVAVPSPARRQLALPLPYPQATMVPSGGAQTRGRDEPRSWRPPPPGSRPLRPRPPEPPLPPFS